MQWILPTPDSPEAGQLAGQLEVSPLLAALLQARGWSDPETARHILAASLRDLSDPLLAGGMAEGVGRLQQARENQESILIFGDYDVDGITSTVLLTTFLHRFGIAPRFAVPRRLDEGYGLSLESLERILADGLPELLIAVDCGTSSHGEVAWLHEKGVSVIILDHHAAKETVPGEAILINPHVRDSDTAPWINLCSVGLIFKFCHAFLKVRREAGDPVAREIDLRDFLDLVALGTVADLVPLEGENRILVRHGLRLLQARRRPGLSALMEVAGLEENAELTPVDIGFRLGPRINASGRLEDANLPIQLLLSEDPAACRTAAEALDALNRERQDIEREITERAEELVHQQFWSDPGIVVHEPGWHAGVVGIVASRLARQFNRPSLVLGSDNGHLLKGSGRSVAGVSLVEVLGHCERWLVQWGGHPMAVGLSVQEDHLEGLRKAFNDSLRRLFPEGLPEPSLITDAYAELEELDEALLEEIEQLAPFGQGNPEPVLILRKACLAAMFPMGKAHYRFTVERNGKAPLEGVAWNGLHRPPPLAAPLDLAVRFQWNSWRGQRNPRLSLVDWRLPEPA